MPIYDLKCPNETCDFHEDDFLGTHEEAVANKCPKCSTAEAPINLVENWGRRRLGGQMTDVKKLPNGDVVSRTRLLGSPNTWDKNPTKFSPIAQAQIERSQQRAKITETKRRKQ